MDKPILLTAIRAALEAGKEIMAVYTDPNSDFEIEKKADNCKDFTSDSLSPTQRRRETDSGRGT